MDAEYVAYFSQRAEQLKSGRQLFPPLDIREPDSDTDARQAANAAVDAARQAGGAALRPDAEASCYVLALELVARPVLQGAPGAAADLTADVAADAATIVRAA